MRLKELICKWERSLHFYIMQYSKPTIRKCTLIPLPTRIQLKHVHIFRPTALGTTQPHLVQILKYMRLKEVNCKWKKLQHFDIMQYSNPTTR